jgi:3-oxoadipate enol-lactonase
VNILAARNVSSPLFWETPMPSIDAGGIRIHHAVSGREDGPAVLFSNSLGSSLRMWDKVLPALEAEYRVLRYDTRGHGASSVPSGSYTLDQLGRDVLHLLDGLGVDRVSFIGLSMGGMVGMWLAIYAPQRIGRMVLANTAARIGTPALWDERIAAVREGGMEALAEAMLSRWFTAEYRRTHPSEMNQVRQMIASTTPDGYCACCAVLRDADLRPVLASILTPCLVIAGKYDPATSPSDGQALASGISGSQYFELETAHLSAWERAGEFAAAVRAFFDNGGRRSG